MGKKRTHSCGMTDDAIGCMVVEISTHDGFAAGIEAAAKWHDAEAERIRRLALDSGDPHRLRAAQDNHLSYAAFIRALANAEHRTAHKQDAKVICDPLMATSASANPVNACETEQPSMSEVYTQTLDSSRRSPPIRSHTEKLLAALEACAEHPGTHADDLAWAKTEIAREALAEYRGGGTQKE